MRGDDSWYEREENDIHERFERGEISSKQRDKELSDLRYELRAQYENEQEDARQRVDDEWGFR